MAYNINAAINKILNDVPASAKSHKQCIGPPLAAINANGGYINGTIHVGAADNFHHGGIGAQHGWKMISQGVIPSAGPDTDRTEPKNHEPYKPGDMMILSFCPDEASRSQYAHANEHYHGMLYTGEPTGWVSDYRQGPRTMCYGGTQYKGCKLWWWLYRFNGEVNYDGPSATVGDMNAGTAMGNGTGYNINFGGIVPNDEFPQYKESGKEGTFLEDSMNNEFSSGVLNMTMKGLDTSTFKHTRIYKATDPKIIVAEMYLPLEKRTVNGREDGEGWSDVDTSTNKNKQQSSVTSKTDDTSTGTTPAPENTSTNIKTTNTSTAQPTAETEQPQKQEEPQKDTNSYLKDAKPNYDVELIEWESDAPGIRDAQLIEKAYAGEDTKTQMNIYVRDFILDKSNQDDNDLLTKYAETQAATVKAKKLANDEISKTLNTYKNQFSYQSNLKSSNVYKAYKQDDVIHYVARIVYEISAITPLYAKNMDETYYIVSHPNYDKESKQWEIDNNLTREEIKKHLAAGTKFEMFVYVAPKADMKSGKSIIDILKDDAMNTATNNLKSYPIQPNNIEIGSTSMHKVYKRLKEQYDYYFATVTIRVNAQPAEESN